MVVGAGKSYIDVSNERVFNIEKYVKKVIFVSDGGCFRKVGESNARAEEATAVAGDSVGKPYGIGYAQGGSGTSVWAYNIDRADTV